MIVFSLSLLIDQFERAALALIQKENFVIMKRSIQIRVDLIMKNFEAQKYSWNCVNTVFFRYLNDWC